MQYYQLKNKRIGQFACRNVPTCCPLWKSTMSPAARRTEKMTTLVGFASTLYVSTDCTVGPAWNHSDTGREPAIKSHTVGIHRALDDRAPGSRSSQKSPRMPATKMRVAIRGGILGFRLAIENFRLPEPPDQLGFCSSKHRSRRFTELTGLSSPVSSGCSVVDPRRGKGGAGVPVSATYESRWYSSGLL